MLVAKLVGLLQGTCTRIHKHVHTLDTYLHPCLPRVTSVDPIEIWHWQMNECTCLNVKNDTLPMQTSKPEKPKMETAVRQANEQRFLCGIITRVGCQEIIMQWPYAKRHAVRRSVVTVGARRTPSPSSFLRGRSGVAPWHCGTMAPWHIGSGTFWDRCYHVPPQSLKACGWQRQQTGPPSPRSKASDEGFGLLWSVAR